MNTSSPRRPPTLADVAARAGVSKTTVSRVLNNRPSPIPIRQETIERIVTAAAELGYRPSPTARGPRRERSRVLCMILREAWSSFTGAVIEAFSESAKARGYRVMLSRVGSGPPDQEYFLQLFSDRISEGVLIAGDSPEEGRLIAALTGVVEHIVGFAHGDLLPGLVSVNVDDTLGTNLALDYLYGLGHQRIAHIARLEYGALRLRMEAYKQYMAAKGLGVPQDYIRAAPNSRASSGYQATLALLDVARPPTAIYAANDGLAFGALRAAAERGVRVPTELSIIGFDDLNYSAFTCPPLTTVHCPIAELAQKAAEVLIEMIEGRRPADAPMNYVLKPTLVVRASCAAPHTP